jgi:hypothetical protein
MLFSLTVFPELSFLDDGFRSRASRDVFVLDDLLRLVGPDADFE